MYEDKEREVEELEGRIEELEEQESDCYNNSYSHEENSFHYDDNDGWSQDDQSEDECQECEELRRKLEIRNKAFGTKESIRLIEDQLESSKLTIARITNESEEALETIRLRDGMILSLKGLIEDLKRQKNASKKSSRVNNLDSSLVLTKLKELLDCPITCTTIFDPVLTPCGYTVDKSTMQKLIKEKQKDPFTNLEKCVKIIPNYFARQVIQLLKILYTSSILVRTSVEDSVVILIQIQSDTIDNAKTKIQDKEGIP